MVLSNAIYSEILTSNGQEESEQSFLWIIKPKRCDYSQLSKGYHDPFKSEAGEQYSPRDFYEVYSLSESLSTGLPGKSV